MAKLSITPPDAPAPVGPYSPAVEANGFMFLSGQVALDEQGNLVGQTIAEQTRAALDNMRRLVGAAGLTMDDVVKTTVYLTDMADFSDMNRIYAEFFRAPYPARCTVQVAALANGFRVEIEGIAVCR